MNEHNPSLDTREFLSDMADLLRQCERVRAHLSKSASLEVDGTTMHNMVALDEALNKLSQFLRNHSICLIEGVWRSKGTIPPDPGDEWKAGGA